jgi:hypothetical protein
MNCRQTVRFCYGLPGKIASTLVVLLAASSPALASPPTVTNVVAAQRVNDPLHPDLVDISYSLTCDTPACTVSVQVSTNNGASYNLTATNFTGNGYGSWVAPGSRKPILWNAGADWPGRYSSQAWIKVTAFERSTNPLTFNLVTNIIVDDETGSIWGQPVFDGSNIVVSREAGSISARRYDLDLNALGSFVTVATTNDTGGLSIADHKHVFQNGYHYLVFSISGSGDGGSLWLVKFDRDLNRVGIVQVVTNEPPTNDMLLFNDGTYVYVGKFYPEGQAAHKIYKYDGDLNFIASYLEGTGSNNHANADTAMYLDERFYFVSPQYVGPAANDKYYRVVYDTNFNVVKARETILQESTKLGTVNGISYYNGRFIVHYCRGSNEGNPIARAVYDAETWSLVQNETVIAGSNHASHTVIVGDALYLGYTEQNPAFHSRLVKYNISETPSIAMQATGIGYAGPISLDTRGLALLAADFDGDLKADPALYVASSGTWYVKLSASAYGLVILPFGGPDFSAVARDFDGDGKADPTVYTAAGGKWQVKLSGSGYATAVLDDFGGAAYLPVAGDYDGDGKADPAIYNTGDGTWSVAMSSAGYAVQGVSGFGGTNRAAVPANYDSDHRFDAAIYNQTNGNWSVLLSAANYITANLLGFGGTGYEPLRGDFDGDGLADPAIYQAGTWQVKLSGSGYATASLEGFGGSGYLAAAADYDGDGKADLTLLDLATGTWHIKLSGSGYAEATLASGWTP